MKPVIFFLSIMILSLAGLAHARDNEGNDNIMKYRDADQNNDGKITAEEWRGAFDNYDWNGNGVLSGDELRRGASRYQVTSASLEQFRRIDRDYNGVISRSEWTGATQEFKRLDQNHNGNLSVDEFDQRLSYQFSAIDRNNSGAISRSEWTGTTQEFNRLDQDRNGHISAEEFYQSPGLDQFSELDYNNDGIIKYNEWSPNSRRSFDVLDLNRDGKLTRDEFYNQQQYTLTVFQELDQNNNGRILRSEWRSTSEAFNRLDTNGDNLLSENEFNTPQSNSIAVQILHEIFKKQ